MENCKSYTPKKPIIHINNTQIKKTDAMSEWKEILLADAIKDIAAGPFGSNLPKSSFTTHGFPIIDGANLKEFKVTDNITKFVTEEKARSLHRAIAKKGDIVVTISGTVGQIAYIPQTSKYPEYLVSQRQFRCTFDTTTVDVPYIVYYFHSFEGKNKILQFANQVGVPALSQPLKNFRNITLQLPPLSEQKKIAAILSSLDEKIETNRRINARLEELAQALFKSWFIDFEPFGGKMPDDWGLYDFNDVVEVISGGTPKTDIAEYWDGNIPWISVKDFINEPHFVMITERFITKEGLNHSATNVLQPTDTIISARGTVGALAQIQEPMAFNQSCFGLRSKIEHGEHWLYFAMHNKIKELKQKSHGSVFDTINRKTLADLRISVPSENTLRQFDEVVTPILYKLLSLTKESARLAALRDTLLPKLMSGELIPE
jgi:type I restriction enzyme S subunit